MKNDDNNPAGGAGPQAPPAGDASPRVAGAGKPSNRAKPSAQDTGRPNVLVIEADDMRADELRFMPSVSSLIAARGLTFENSFAPNPLCCPSRASFLTGQYSHNHGVVTHEPPYGFGAFEDSDTLAVRLQDVGYRTALIGKYLNGYGDQPVHGTGAPSLTYVPPGWDQWWAGSDHLWKPGDPFQGGTYAYENLTANINGTIESWPGEYTTNVTGRQTRSIIDGFASSEDPWFVWWTPVAPHAGSPVEPDDPGTVPRADGFPVEWETPARPRSTWGMFDATITHGLGTPANGSAEADRSDKPRYLSTLPEMTPAELAALTTVSRQRAEALSVLDQEVGLTMAALKSSGELDDTVIAFTSDNGYYLGEHLKRQGKINLHEPSVRVPLVVAGPGVPVGRRFDPVTSVDLGVSVAAMAGTTLTEADGIDLTGVMRDGDAGWNRPVVLEGRMPEPGYLAAIGKDSWTSPLNTVGIRVGAWKYVEYSTGETELYDLAADPLELNSIAGSAGGMRDRLKNALDRYRSCAGQACNEPLTGQLALTPGANELQTQAQLAATQNFYS